MSDDATVLRRRRPGPSVPDRDPGVVVVGGGAAGLAAAAAVRGAGVDVVLVSRGPLGGDCTWHGCVPSKSLLEAAAAGLGARAAVDHARSVVARVARAENEHALRAAGVDVVRAGALLGPEAVVTLEDGTRLRPRLGVVLATGSRPGTVEGLPVTVTSGDGPVVRDTDGWLDGLAEHLARAGAGGGTGDGTGQGTGAGARDVVVVGGGTSGLELSQALARLRAAGPGGTVSLIEVADDLLPDLPGAGGVLAAALRADGVQVLTGVRPHLLPGLVSGAGLVLLTAGRVPVLDVLGPGAGVTTRGGAVVVDDRMATSAPRVRAAGDVVGVSPSTHVAVATGRVAAAGLLAAHPGGPRTVGPDGVGPDGAGPDERPARFDAAWVPRVVWTDPQVAAVGRVPGGPGTRSVRVPLSRNDRAPAAAVPGSRDRSRGGFAQVWLEPGTGGGRVVGALVVGPQAGEMIAEVALVGRLGLEVQEWVGGQVGLGGTSAHHPYPAWSWTWALLADRALTR